jgi:hypothetical protein
MVPTKTAIIVSGMHRCGTSAIAGVLHLLGASLPRKLMPAMPENPRGFFESLDVKALNDRIFADAGREWCDWRSVAVPEPGHAGFDSCRQEALRILSEDFGAADFIVAKDPRFSRLMPFWGHVLPAAGFRVCHVVAVRHPDEVAESLRARNAFLVTRSKLLWSRHYLDIELYTRGQPRVFVDYRDFLLAWEPCVERVATWLGFRWPCSPEDARAQVAAFLARDLQHYHAAAELAAAEGGLSSHDAVAFEALRRLVRDPGCADAIAALKALRADFAAMEQVCGDAYAEVDAVRFTLESERNAARAEAAALTSSLEEARVGMLDALTARDDALAERNAALAAVEAMPAAPPLGVAASSVADPPAVSGLAEVLRHDGADFVTAAYQLILERRPDDEGLRFYLGRVMHGTAKIQILAEIARSAEARASARHVAALAPAAWLYRLAQVPFLGAVIRAFSGVEGNSASEQRLRALEQALHTMQR